MELDLRFDPPCPHLCDGAIHETLDGGARRDSISWVRREWTP